MIQSISSASQASNNLLVNREQDSIETNDRVQECLAQAKAAGEVVVRYIQLVEDEEYIGTLLDSNERVNSAIQLYDNMLKAADEESGKIQPMNTGESGPELIRLQGKQRAALQRTKERNASLDNLYHGITSPHPDLQDITFGDLGSATDLPPPIRPNERDLDTYGQNRGSLSDYSDYDSSDEEIQRPTATRHSYPSSSRAHDNVFEDSHSASPPGGIPPRKQYVH
ncbi:hypothetical protein BS47DRAFT_1342821 [Hydnum rufescens UP504]|uniref:GAT domain-containing protein n=1 Tax=Hydnum rufescens UP504 TaxID=1448309 RepID=A0A9P6AZF4_9AGAM|nr:hypothetical protein BS47DRAFT_1342821 [Hydnum rufescens UP504]